MGYRQRMAAFSFRRFGDWAAVARIASTMAAKMVRAQRVAVMREAHFLRAHMVKGIASQAPGGQAFAPLSPITLALRKMRGFGGSKALIVTGGLRGAITVVQVAGGTGAGGKVFVGVHRSAKGPGGKTMANIAEIHENGRSWTQRMTPKARRFLAMVISRAGGAVGAALRPKGPTTRNSKGRFVKAKFVGKANSNGSVHISIPARPFVGPVLAAYARPADVKQRFLDNLLAGLGGDFKRLAGQ